jgi:hypothetical protein
MGIYLFFMREARVQISVISFIIPCAEGACVRRMSHIFTVILNFKGAGLTLVKTKWVQIRIRRGLNIKEQCIVTCIPIAGQRLGKHIAAEATARNRIANQEISKHTSLKTEIVFPAWSVQSGYGEDFSIER